MRADAPAKRALFPISVSNQAFSTRRVLPALRAMVSTCTEVVVFIADHLQIYNKALQIADGAALPTIISEFAARQDYREQRGKWVQRIVSQMQGTEAARWTTIGVDDISDRACFGIFRNVMVAYYSVCSFRADVDASAEHSARSRDPHCPFGLRERLSRGYLLEEIALNVRLHVVDGIDDEYYMGEQSGLLLNLYNSKYGFDAFDLADVPGARRPIRFFGLNGDPSEGWREHPPAA